MTLKLELSNELVRLYISNFPSSKRLCIIKLPKFAGIELESLITEETSKLLILYWYIAKFISPEQIAKDCGFEVFIRNV